MEILTEGSNQPTSHAGTDYKIWRGGGGIPSYTPTPVDIRLQDICVDWVHTNNGWFLSGGIADNATWQR